MKFADLDKCKFFKTAIGILHKSHPNFDENIFSSMKQYYREIVEV